MLVFTNYQSSSVGTSPSNDPQTYINLLSKDIPSLIAALNDPNGNSGTIAALKAKVQADAQGLMGLVSQFDQYPIAQSYILEANYKLANYFQSGGTTSDLVGILAGFETSSWGQSSYCSQDAGRMAAIYNANILMYASQMIGNKGQNYNLTQSDQLDLYKEMIGAYQAIQGLALPAAASGNINDLATPIGDLENAVNNNQLVDPSVIDRIGNDAFYIPGDVNGPE